MCARVLQGENLEYETLQVKYYFYYRLMLRRYRKEKGEIVVLPSKTESLLGRIRTSKTGGSMGRRPSVD